MTTTLNTNTINTVTGFNGTSGTYTTSLAGGGGYLISNGTFSNSYSMADNVMTVNGSDSSLTVKGKVIINGKDLEERLSNLEKVLGIPEYDGEMFIKYPSLKVKYDDYINELSKKRTWDALKG